MIRLVTQFDLPASRPVHATPTCSSSSCCSCSCCVGTAVASLAFTAMDVYCEAQASVPEAARRQRWGPAALGALALPVGVGGALLILLASDSAGLGVLAGLALWLGLVVVAYVLAGRAFGSALSRMGAIFVVALFAGTIEFSVGFAAQASLAYIVVEFVAGGAAVFMAYRVTRAG